MKNFFFLMVSIGLVSSCGPNLTDEPTLTGTNTDPLDNRVSFEGTWAEVMSTTVAGHTSVQDEQLTVAPVGASTAMNIIDSHGCIIFANATSASAMTTTPVTCPTWQDTANCNVTTMYGGGTGAVAGGNFTLHLPGTVVRQCQGSVADDGTVFTSPTVVTSEQVDFKTGQ